MKALRCLVALTMFLAGCSRPGPGHVRFKLDQPQSVSLGLFDESGDLVAQPLRATPLPAGSHDVDCAALGVPEGTYTWKTIAFDPPTLEPIASIGSGVVDFSEKRDIAGGDLGPPCAVAADEHLVFLGWRRARAGHEVVACEPNGKMRWGHHHGPGDSGVRGLAADGGTVFVLADRDGGTVYRLDAQTGEPVPWKGRAELQLTISSLWGADAKSAPANADYITAKNGRIYLTFVEAQFVGVIDAADGVYVTTLTGPQPGSMSFNITPMRDPQTGEQKIIDFGVAAIAGNGLAYFIMEHDPTWVMMSTTRWLQQDERIAALTLWGDTMKSDKVTIYTALGAPHHQVQLRPADAVEGFAVAVGRPGGRPESGPWQADGLRDIRGVAVDAREQLWVVEGNEKFGRFTVWKTDGKQGTLVREIFGPLDPKSLRVETIHPLRLTLGGMRWEVDPAKRTVTCLEEAPGEVASITGSEALRDSSGLQVWSPPESAGKTWSVYGTTPDPVYAFQCGTGVSVFGIGGLRHPPTVGSGRIEVKRPD